MSCFALGTFKIVVTWKKDNVVQPISYSAPNKNSNFENTHTTKDDLFCTRVCGFSNYPKMEVLLRFWATHNLNSLSLRRKCSLVKGFIFSCKNTALVLLEKLSDNFPSTITGCRHWVAKAFCCWARTPWLNFRARRPLFWYSQNAKMSVRLKFRCR